MYSAYDSADNRSICLYVCLPIHLCVYSWWVVRLQTVCVSVAIWRDGPRGAGRAKSTQAGRPSSILRREPDPRSAEGLRAAPFVVSFAASEAPAHDGRCSESGPAATHDGGNAPGYTRKRVGLSGRLATAELSEQTGLAWAETDDEDQFQGYRHSSVPPGRAACVADGGEAAAFWIAVSVAVPNGA